MIKQIMGAVGLGLAGQQFVIGVDKTFVPFLAGFTTIPLVYGATTAVCAVMDYYFRAQAKGVRMSPDEMKRVWANARAKGAAEGKQRKDDIRRGKYGDETHAP